MLLALIASASVFSKSLACPCPEALVPNMQLANEECDIPCMTALCHFDSQPGDIRSPCAASCACSSSVLGDGHCDLPCCNLQCGWDLGDCGYCAHDCTSHTGFPHDLGNSVCDSACNNALCAWDAGDCTVLFVSENRKASSSGTIDAPYWTLAEAVEAVSGNSTTIEILRGRYVLGWEVENRLVRRWDSLESDYPPISLTIEGLLCSQSTLTECGLEPPVLILDNQHPVKFLVIGHLVMKNLRLDGETSLLQSCIGALCSYCPTVYEEALGLVTDQGVEVDSGAFAPQLLCDPFHSLDFFEIRNGGQLTLDSVTVQSFRQQFRSIVSFPGNGNVTLINVSFANIAVYSAVLRQSSASSDFEAGRLLLDSVTLRLLNNGYEYRPTLAGGFLLTTGLALIEMRNVDVEAALLGASEAIVKIYNAVWVNITDSRFCNNVGVVCRIDSTLSFPLQFSDESGMSLYSQVHIQILNSIWENNTGSSVVEILVRGSVQNIALSNLSFHSNLCLVRPLLTIEYTKKWDYIEVDGGLLSFLIGGSRKEVSVPPRNITLSRIAFSGNFAQSALALTNVANVQIQSSYFSSNGDTRLSSLQSLTLSAISQIPDSYVSTILNIAAENLQCVGTLYINSSSRTDISCANFTDNYCGNGPPALYAILVSDHLNLQTVRITGNTGAAGSIVYIQANDSVLLVRLTVGGNSLTSILGSGVLYLVGASVNSSFDVRDTVFSENNAHEGGTLTVIGDCAISSTLFRGNRCTGDHAAGLTYSPSLFGHRLAIFNTTFLSGVGTSGAAITLIDKLSTRIPVLFTIANTTFRDNISTGAGSCLYIDSSIGLTAESEIKDTEFYRNSASNACVWVSFFSGILAIRNCMFHFNHGTSSSVLYAQHPKSSEIASRISLQDTIIEFNVGFSIVYLINPDKYTEGLSTNLTFASNTGRGLYLQYTYWKDWGSRFYNNSSPTSAPCFVILFYSQVELNGTVLTGNRAELTAGTIAMGILSKIVISNALFERNSAARGGAVYGEQGVTVTIASCIFRNNTSTQEGSAVYFLTGPLTSANSTVIGSTFIDNTSTQSKGVVVLVTSYMIFQDCIFQRNVAISAPGVVVILSILTVLRSTFRQQSSHDGVYLYAAAGSSINISESTFAEGSAIDKGGAMFLSATSVIIANSLFVGLSASYGAAIAAYSQSEIRVTNSKFTGLKAESAYGATIYLNESPIRDRFNIYTDCSNGVIVGEAADIDIRGSVFEGKYYSDASSISGAGVYCRDCGVVKVRSALFQRLTAESGACLHLQSSRDSGLLNVSRTDFVSSQSVTSGAVLLENDDALIIDCNFLNNSAQGTLSLGDGGALYLSCPTVAEGCRVQVINSVFHGNSATHNGGAIYWSDWEPTLQNVTFTDNFAPYGPWIASFAIALKVESDSTLEGIPSGQPFPRVISAQLVDHYGQQVATDNSSLADVLPVFASNTTVSGVTRVLAIAGHFRFSDISIVSAPGKPTSIKITTTGVDLSKDRNDGSHLFEPEATLAVVMRDCVPGETVVGDSCYICPEGKYSLKPSESCANCPTGAVCLGNSTMAPERGYWRASNTTDVFWECPNAEACIGSPSSREFAPTGYCASGYYGNLCHGCVSGYTRSGHKECSKCPEQVINCVQVAGIAVAFGLVIVFIIKMSLVSAHRQQSHSSVYLKIFVNYMQLTSAAASVNLNWPKYALQSFTLKESAANASTQLFSFDCLIDSGDTENQADTLYLKCLVLAGVPVLIIAAALVFWGLATLVLRTKGYLKYQMVNSIVVVFFIAHPNIISFMFDMFNCRELSAGEYWLDSYLNIRCWDRRHSQYAVLVALPALMLWGVFTPLIALLVMTCYRRRLLFLDMRIRLGFLYTGYVAAKYYWEFVIMYRKMVVIAMAVFLVKVSTMFQALGVLLVLVVSLAMQVYNSPYNYPVFNQLEKRSILVSTVTLYCGLFYLTQELGTGARAALFALIVLANLYFLLLWGVKIGEVGIRALGRKCPCFSRFLTVSAYIVPQLKTRSGSSLNASADPSIEMSMDRRSIPEPPQNSMLEAGSMEPPLGTPTLGVRSY